MAEPGICPLKDAAAAVVECSRAELRLDVVITYRREHDDSNQKWKLPWPKSPFHSAKTCGRTTLSLTISLNQSQRRVIERCQCAPTTLFLQSLRSIGNKQSTKNVVNNPNQGRIHVRLILVLIPSQILYKITKLNRYPSGGLELLFSSQRSHKIALPSTDPATNQPVNVGFLIDWLCKNLMKDPRQDMFVLEGTV
jgi:hypothetical protein